MDSSVTPAEAPIPPTPRSTAAVAPAARTPRPSALARWRAFLAVPLDAHALPALDGVRGFAAVLVFLVHYHAAFGHLLPTGTWLHENPTFPAALGFQGLNIFFVLSGFLIYGALLGRPVPFPVFLRRRLQRIYPVFLAVLALYLVLGALFPERSKLPPTGKLEYVVANLLLLPGVFPIRPIITVSWSLSFELFFYLALTLVVGALGLRRWPSPARVALLLSLVVAWLVSSPATQERVSSFIMFVPGLLLWEVTRRIPGRVRANAAVELGVWALFLVTIVTVPLLRTEAVPADLGQSWGAPELLSFLALGTAIPLFLFYCVRGQGLVVRSMSGRFLRYLGITSYSFYLLHGLTINFLEMVLGPALRAYTAGGAANGPLLFAALMPVAFVACVATAHLLFTTVERRLSF